MKSEVPNESEKFPSARSLADWCVANSYSRPSAIFTPALWATVLLVIGLSYGQNIAFTLTARARTRNNAFYHLCAVLVSSLVAFLTFRTILGPNSDFSLILLLAYTTGTISGSLTGAYISMWIERLTGARMDETDKDAIARNEAGNRKVAFKIFPVILVIEWSCQFIFFNSEDILPLLGIVILVFFPDMAYAMRTWIQNRDNHYLTSGIGLVSGVIDFFRWTYLIKFDMRWGIFVPYATGGTRLTGRLSNL